MKARDVVVAAIAVALTVFVGLIALNFRTGEKQIEQTIASLCDARPPVARAMGVRCWGRSSTATG
jgi:hypothetical protein